MKKMKILLIFMVIILIFGGCKPKVERTQADKAYHEYCLIYVDIFATDKISENWDEKRIEYLNSKEFEVKYEKLKTSVENYRAIISNEELGFLRSMEEDIETADKFIYYAEKYKETGKYQINEITNEERLETALLQDFIKITWNSKMKILEVWKKTIPVYKD